jgi:hypothetical protein
MRYGTAAIVAIASVAWAGGSACAMNADSTANADCLVSNGEKLPHDSGGPEFICAAIQDALKAVPNAQVKVQVQVKSNAWLVARIERNGVILPEQNMAVADRTLSKSMIERFARAIGQAVSAAGR